MPPPIESVVISGGIMILSIVIAAIGLLIYWVRAHEHAEWVKTQKGLVEIELKKQKYLRELYEKELEQLEVKIREEEKEIEQLEVKIQEEQKLRDESNYKYNNL